MKRGAPLHPKMLRLAELLGIQRLMAVGIMEALWHWCADYAPAGNVGRFTDKQIAAGIGYEGDGEGLVKALSTAGFVDPDDEHRLLIHDWSEHAELSVHTLLARQRLRFCDGFAPSLRGLKGVERGPARTFYLKHQGRSTDSPRTVPGRSSTSSSLSSAFALSPASASTPTQNTCSPSGERVRAPAAPKIDPAVLTAIYDAYPRHVGRKAALATIQRAVHRIAAENGGDLATAGIALLAHVREYAASGIVKGSEPRYIPHPATWMNAERWRDDRAEWAAPTANGQAPKVSEEAHARIAKEVFGDRI